MKDYYISTNVIEFDLSPINHLACLVKGGLNLFR
ncbi:hypothetical protein VIAE109791_13165 [Vibrio aestuarianus subsp. francensis]